MISTNTGTNFINVMSSEPEKLNEILDSTEFHDWMVMLLSEEFPITVTFNKKDGTSRTMKCTRNGVNIPEDKHPKGTTENESASKAIKVFDLDKQEWRSFLQTSITRIEFDLK
jgi:hypothetical protein